MSWSNDKPMNIRQKLSIRLIFLAVKIVAPYEYEHQFQKEWDDIQKLLNGDDQPKAKNPEPKK